MLFVGLFFLGIHGFTQNKLSSKDSISTFDKVLIFTLKAEYLHKNNFDWIQTDLKLNQRLQQYQNFKNSLKEIDILFQDLEADHIY